MRAYLSDDDLVDHVEARLARGSSRHCLQDRLAMIWTSLQGTIISDRTLHEMKARVREAITACMDEAGIYCGPYERVLNDVVITHDGRGSLNITIPQEILQCLQDHATPSLISSN
jgi:hypothetical protein